MRPEAWILYCYQRASHEVEQSGMFLSKGRNAGTLYLCKGADRITGKSSG